MAIKINLQETEQELFCCSKWWGDPDLPADMEYPLAKAEEDGEEFDYPLTFVCQIDCADIPDLVPILAVAASSAQGTTVFDNIRRLRIKESDRVQSILQLLGMAGIYAFASDNTLTVTGGPARSCAYDPLGDHRMAMAATILASVKNVNITISDAECTAKSYPAFFDDFNALGGIVLKQQ